MVKMNLYTAVFRIKTFKTRKIRDLYTLPSLYLESYPDIFPKQIKFKYLANLNIHKYSTEI